MPRDHPSDDRPAGAPPSWAGLADGPLLPVTAAALALAYLVAAWTSLGLPIVAVVAVAATCAVVLVHRRSRPMRVALGAIAAWLALGMGGAVALAGRPLAGLLATVLALFVVPLLVVPALYARTFHTGEGAEPRPIAGGSAQARDEGSP